MEIAARKRQENISSERDRTFSVSQLITPQTGHPKHQTTEQLADSNNSASYTTLRTLVFHCVAPLTE